MDRITLCDLEVFYRVGVTEAERAQPQRLLLTVEMEHDLAPAAASDRLADTIDYFAVTQRLLRLGEGRHWELIEAVAGDIAQLVLRDFRAQRVSVEVKKFVLPQARYVSVHLSAQA
ncbi:MAG: dihydroneopterin aldolase [Verrucomicrobia bacterium]|nr:dihydroneopterin aldolase [Verrucomicrobiota bacterium]